LITSRSSTIHVLKPQLYTMMCASSSIAQRISCEDQPRFIVQRSQNRHTSTAFIWL
jgi:hypothetical protein